MIKFYFIILFIGIALFGTAQDNKTSEPSYSSELVRAKVLKMFPNPAVDFINFEFIRPVQKDLTLQVFNFIGKKVLEVSVVSQKISVPLNDLYRGVYIFQLRDKSGRIVESGKFQVNK
jgi:hypothetical protein